MVEVSVDLTVGMWVDSLVLQMTGYLDVYRVGETVDLLVALKAPGRAS